MSSTEFTAYKEFILKRWPNAAAKAWSSTVYSSNPSNAFHIWSEPDGAGVLLGTSFTEALAWRAAAAEEGHPAARAEINAEAREVLEWWKDQWFEGGLYL